jgi:hypothetical protein
MTIGGSVKFGDILDRLYEAGKEIRTYSSYARKLTIRFMVLMSEQKLDFAPVLAWWERHSGVA